MTTAKRIAAMSGTLMCLIYVMNSSAQTVATVTSTTTCVQTNSQTVTCTTPATSFTLTAGVINPPTPTAPSGCSVLATATTVAVGSLSPPQLSVSCTTQGTAPLSYAWIKGNSTSPISTLPTYTLTAADVATIGTYTYSAVVSNTVGSAPSAQLNVTVTPVLPPPPPEGVNYCPNGQTQSANFDASTAYLRLNSTNLVGANAIYVVKMNVPASGASSAGRYPALLSHIEAPGETPSARVVSLSRNLCDFNDGATLLGPTATEGAKELTVQEPNRGYRNLEPGTWYISVRASSCTQGKRCNVALEWVNY